MSEKSRLVKLFTEVMDLREYTKADLARKLQTSETTVGKFVDPRSTAMPSMDNLIAIAKFVSDELPAGHEFGWIQTIDDLMAYLQGRNAAPPISPKQALRMIAMSESPKVLCGLISAACQRLDYLTTPETESEQSDTQTYKQND